MKTLPSRRVGSFAILGFLLCVLFQSSARLNLLHSKPLASGSDSTAIVGTWRFIRGVYGGKVYEAKGDVVIKHITDTHFAWLRYKADTKEVIGAAGGTRSLTNGVYAETPSYGFGPTYKEVRDKPQHFESKIDGDEWRIQVEGGKHLDETWRRERN